MISRRDLGFLLFGSGVAANANADPGQPELTMEQPNGRFWKGLTEQEKMYFVLTFLRGLQWSCVITSRALSPEAAEKARSAIADDIPDLNISEIRDSITLFYAEPTNALIPVGAMISVVTEKSKGANAMQVEQLLSLLRGGYSKQNH